MSENVVLPSALAELNSRLHTSTDEADLLQVLRALQRMCWSEADLSVHIERLRAGNDVTERDAQFEQNCLHALDLVSGYSVSGLQWNSAALAPIFLAAVLDHEALSAGCAYAVTPNDLLPRRPTDRLPQELSDRLVELIQEDFRRDDYSVKPADVYRTPKSEFTTRPAALLALPDRLALEALAELIDERLDRALPAGVLWPRGRAKEKKEDTDFRSVPLEWNSAYVVKADISDFYSSVGHTILGLITSTHLSMPTKYGQAVESFLSALMDVDRGLPQGVPASDIFASTFLLPVDRYLAASETIFVRYADDYLFPAASPQEGRATLRRLEEGLRSIGLTLNDEKTAVMRSSTYKKGLSANTGTAGTLKGTLQDSLLEIQDSDDPASVIAKLEEYGAEEESLWGLVYHGNLSLEEVIDEIRESIDSSLVEVYRALLAGLVLKLESGERIESGERLGRECLTFLAGARSVVPLDQIDTLIEWFPKLVPLVSAYLSSIADSAQDDIAGLLVRSLDRHPKLDWATGWLCGAVERSEFVLGGDLEDRLVQAATDKREGLLTRTSAVRVLAKAGELDEAVWRGLFADATPAVQSEMAFSALFEPSFYPWALELCQLDTSELPACAVRALRSAADSGV